MRASNAGQDLPPIAFELVPITPLPLVTEVDWSEWDRAVSALDEASPDGQAKALADQRFDPISSSHFFVSRARLAMAN